MSDTLPESYGKYVLLRRVAVGGMAEIFRAKTVGAEGFERDIAIKRILPNYTSDDSFVKMFKDEANIAARLSHANIVQIFDFDLHAGTYYIAMEFIEGRDLKDVMDAGIAAGQPLSPLLASQIIIDVCSGLHYAHTKSHRGQPLNIVHRDVSPHNIMISYQGEVKLMDFGIAKARQRFTQTQAGLVKGKCAYMSPEQVRGKALDGRSDLFALAVVFWEVLTRQRLFAGNTDYVTLSNVVKADVPSTRSINPDVPQELDRILRRALERDRDQRYADVAEFQRELQHFYYSEAAAAENISLGDYMQWLFTDEIRSMLEQQTEERTDFLRYMESGAVRPTAPPAAGGTASSRTVAEPSMASAPAPAPRPASAPPSQPPKVAGGSLQGGTAAGGEDDVDRIAMTVPLATLKKQLQERLAEGSAPQPGPAGGTPPGATGAIDYSDDGDLAATVAMSAIPLPAGGRDARAADPSAPTVSSPLVRPSATGVAYGGSEGSDVNVAMPKGRKGLVAFLLILAALAVGFGAFFLVRHLSSGPKGPGGVETRPRVGAVAQADTVGTTALEAHENGGTGEDAGTAPVVPGEAVADTASPAPRLDVPSDQPTGPDGGGSGEVPVVEARVNLTIELDPPDARLFVNNEAQAARTLSGIAVGTKLSLRAEKPNYVPAVRDVIASADATTIHLRLNPLRDVTVEVALNAPVPAAVTVDGKPLGITPQTLKGHLSQTVRIQATAEGYLPYEGTATLQPGVPINLPLRKAALLILRLDPPTATVKIGGARLRPKPGRPGVYELTTHAIGAELRVEATAPRHHKLTRTLTLSKERETIRIALREIRSGETAPPRPQGTVRLNARPWADIYLNGRRLGRSPYTGKVPAGSHRFTFKKGDKTRSLTVVVRPNQTTSRVVDMRD